MKNRILLSVLWSLLAASICWAAPGVINYQGRLTDAGGNPIITSVNVTFTFWNAESGGSQLGGGFSDTDSVTPDEDGLYATLIGDAPGNLVTDSIFSGDSVWLNVNVGGEDLIPRLRMTSVGYAVKASRADSATSASHALMADNATNSGYADTATTATYSSRAEQVKQVVRDFVLAPGQSVTAGDVVAFLSGKTAPYEILPDLQLGGEQKFNAAITTYISAAALSADKFVVAYCDIGNSYYGTAIIGEVTETSITWGSEHIFRASRTEHISASALSADKFVVACNDSGGMRYGLAIVGDVSGNSITWGGDHYFNSAVTQNISTSALSSSRFVVAYREVSSSINGTAIIGEVSGTSITWGSESIFNAASSGITSASALSSNRFILAYQDGGSSNNGTAIIGAVSGNSITWSNEFVFNAASTTDLSASALSSNQFVVAYQNGGNSNNGTAIIGDVSGDYITWGSESIFNASSTSSVSVSALSADKFVVAYQDGGNLDYGTATTGKVSGNDFTWGGEQVFNSASSHYISALALSSKGFVAVYSDIGNSFHGTAVASFAEGGPPLGIAGAGGASGETIPVILDGISDVHSGLAPGADYYANDDSLATDSGNGAFPKIGRALSDTELLLKID